jgi:predicted amino acid-binding ACT domain protein
VFADQGVDLEDITMTRLSGNFATMILARGGEESQLRELLASIAERFGLRIHLEPAVEHGQEPEPDCYISAAGPNKTGIVAALSEALASENANILEMTTRLLERTQVPVYFVRIEAKSGSGGCNALRPKLEALGKKLGIEVRIEPVDSVDL